MPRSLMTPFLIGLLSAITFLLVAMLGFGIFFLFLSVFPLLWIGLSHAPRSALISTAVAAGMIALLMDAYSAVLFLFLMGLPAWYITQYAILFRDEATGRTWYPLGLIWTKLTFYAALLIIAVGMYYAGSDLSLEGILSAKIRATFAQTSDEYAKAVEALANQPFLLFTMMGWLWGLTLYGLAWITNRKLVQQGKNIRPDFTIQIFPLPNLILLLLGMCAAISLLGSAEAAFIAKALFLLLFLPYFFLGCVLLHKEAHSWPSRKLLLFFIYLIIFLQFWPAFLLAGAGLWHHIKHLSGSATSTRS